MDMFDEARAISGMITLLGATQGDVAKRLGVSQSYVANKLRLLGYSDRLIALIRETKISERHARAILRLADDDARGNMIREVSKRGLTVRECEALIDRAVLKADVPEFSRRDALERISNVEGLITRAIEHLVSGGVEARARTSYEGGDMYITVHIKNA